LSGIYYPIEILPKALQIIASVIPLTYFLIYFRSVYGLTPDHSNPLLWGFVLTGAYNIVAAILLGLSIRNARERGLLSKMSE